MTKQLQAASSYQSKLLGMLAVHLSLLVVEKQYGVSSGSSKAHCGNNGAIFTFQKKSKQISIRSVNNDIRVVQTIKV